MRSWTSSWPCGALGLVEVQRRTCGFLAIRPDAILPPTVTAAGFRFGHALLGTSQYTVVHFAFEFYDFARYHLLVRPDHPIVRTVLTRMVDSGEFFFFALDGNGTATTFNADIGRGRDADMAGLRRNLPRIRRAHATEAQYQDALARFRAKPDPPGTLLHWVCRDDERSLDLTVDRLEMTPAG
ncbi:MAG TPA: hypothetical protein PLJ20_09635 [Candidatus Contendobacter sp.]|nr:hypothetical protein [Candidatus Contendobacter sp.]